MVAASYQNILLWGATKSLVQVTACINATLTNVVVLKKTSLLHLNPSFCLKKCLMQFEVSFLMSYLVPYQEFTFPCL